MLTDHPAYAMQEQIRSNHRSHYDRLSIAFLDGRITETEFARRIDRYAKRRDNLIRDRVRPYIQAPNANP